MAFLVATMSLPAVYCLNGYARTTTAGTPHARANIVIIMLVVPNRSEVPPVHKKVFQSNQRMHSVHVQPSTTMYNFVKTMYNLVLPWTVFDNHIQTWTSI